MQKNKNLIKNLFTGSESDGLKSASNSKISELFSKMHNE